MRSTVTCNQSLKLYGSAVLIFALASPYLVIATWTAETWLNTEVQENFKPWVTVVDCPLLHRLPDKYLPEQDKMKNLLGTSHGLVQKGSTEKWKRPE